MLRPGEGSINDLETTITDELLDIVLLRLIE